MADPYRIEIFNYKNEEIVTYSLILLKGKVINKLEKLLINGILIVNNQYEFKIINNLFKIIIELQEDKNDIRIKYNSHEFIFSLYYKPKLSNYKIVPIYIIPKEHNGKFQSPKNINNSIESALNRINIGVKMIQMIIAEKVYEQEYKRNTFESKQCEIFNSELNLQDVLNMNQNELWDYYACELTKKYNNKNIKYLAFLSSTKYELLNTEIESLNYEDIINNTKSHAALGASGLALFGTGCLYTWPEKIEDILISLQDTTPVDRLNFMDDSAYKGTYGGCCSNTIGAVLHELCHTFNLGHTDIGIMGQGFRQIDLIFAQYSDTSIKEETGIKKNKQFWNLRFPFCNDETFFTQSNACILAHHSFITGYYKKASINFNKTSWTIKSDEGLKVIEIRDSDKQLVRKFWCFKPSRKVFIIPRSEIPCDLNEPITLFAEDKYGNIFKFTLNNCDF